MGYDVEYLEKLYCLFKSGKARVDTELKLEVDKITIGNVKVGCTAAGVKTCLLTDNAGRVYVIVDDAVISRAQNVINFTDVATISSATESDILDETVTAGKTWYITSFSAGGEGEGEVAFEVSGTTEAQRNFEINTSLQHIFTTPFKVAAGTQIKVKVTNGAPSSAQFTANMNGFEEDV